MMHYKKGKNVEEDLSKEQIPIEVLPAKFLWMQVKGGTAVHNVVDFAKQALEDGSYRAVVWTGSDGGVGKTVSCAEILKRHFKLHQVTRICYRKVQEFWDPQQDGLEQIVAKRNIPCVHILMSLDEIDPTVPGYQHSEAQAGMWVAGGEQSNGTAGGPRKRPQGQGQQKGNYFTGPQLKKKGNRHYGNGGAATATNEEPQGGRRGRESTQDTGGHPRRGKSKDGGRKGNDGGGGGKKQQQQQKQQKKAAAASGGSNNQSPGRSGKPKPGGGSAPTTEGGGSTESKPKASGE